MIDNGDGEVREEAWAMPMRAEKEGCLSMIWRRLRRCTYRCLRKLFKCC